MTKKCKVLYGLEATDGGTLKHLSYLVNHLNTEIFEVTVIISTQRSNNVYPEIEKMAAAGARVLIVPMKRKISIWHDLKAFSIIWTHLRHNKYDVVHAHSSKAGVLFRIAAWLNRVPSILYTPHCFYFQSKKGIGKLCFVWLERLMASLSTYIIVANNEKKTAIKLNIAPVDKLLNINNAINFGEYIPGNAVNSIVDQFSITEDQIVIAAIGRLTTQKNWQMYIAAAFEVIKEFRNVVFLIVGDGELHDELSGVVKRLNLENNVFFTGYYANIRDIYAIADIIVSTSLWEGLPYVFLEAMWYRKPIISTDLNYWDILFEQENALLTAPDDNKALVNNIKELILDRGKREAMGKYGHDLLKANFSFDFFIKKHEEIYIGDN